MKIIIPEKSDHTIPFNQIPVGAVYRIQTGAVAWRIKDGGAIFLTHADGGDWLEIARGFKGEPAIAILGYVDEIILKEKP